MIVDNNLNYIYQSYKSRNSDIQNLVALWDEISNALLIAPVDSNIQTIVEWSEGYHSRGYKVAQIFSIHPEAAFEQGRLATILLISSDKKFKSALLRYYINNHTAIQKELLCFGYAESKSLTLLGDSWSGTVLEQFMYVNANPFLGEIYLSDQFIGNMSEQECKYFLNCLKNTVQANGRFSRYDEINLRGLLSAPSFHGRDSAIITELSSFWGAALDAGIVDADSINSHIASTLRGVITKTSSFTLYDYVSRNHENISSAFPRHIELMINADLADSGCSRQDDNPEWPTFTLERVIGKSISSRKTQAWMIDYLANLERQPSGIDVHDEKVMFDSILPLLVNHQDAIRAKPSLFNPAEISSSDIFSDLSSGRYFIVGCRAFINADYRRAMVALPLLRVANSEKGFQAYFAPIFGQHYDALGEGKITEAFHGCSVKESFCFLIDLFRQRFKVHPPVYLLKGCHKDVALGVLKLLEDNNIFLEGGATLSAEGIDQQLRDVFISRDLGL